MNKSITLIIALFALITITLASNVYADQIAFDGYESGTFTGGTGWSTNWINTGSVTILGWTYPYAGNRHAYLRGVNALSSRTTNISGYSNLQLRLAVKINSVESTDSAKIIVGNGVTNVTLRTFTSTDSNNTWTLHTFNLDGITLTNNLIIYLKGDMSDLGDEFHVDNVEVIGTLGVPQEVSIFMDDNYVIGSTIPVYASSSEPNTLHTIKLSGTTTFCEVNLMSPSVPNTLFETTCTLPSTQVIDAEAQIYLTNTPSINSTTYFNILELSENLNKLKIEQVYYSPQVLQGGSTEIFAVIKKTIDVNLTKLYTMITFPDGTTRKLSMEPTINDGEYRSFITDTYRTGYTNFTIFAESQTYNAEYTNQYYVVPFSVDYVARVGNVESVSSVTSVDRINEAKLTVHGTEYVANQPGKMWLQLLNSTGSDVTNGVCYTDIYTPSGGYYVENALMTNMMHDGIYYYDFIVPPISGVYPAIAKCYYSALSVPYNATNYTVLTGSISVIVPSTMIADDGKDKTDSVALPEDGLSYHRNLDGIGKAQEIHTVTPMVTGTTLKIRVYGDSNKNLVFSASTLGTIYATQPITTSYNTYLVTLANISGSTTVIYVSDGTQPGGFDVTWDWVEVDNHNAADNINKTFFVDNNYLRFIENTASPARITTYLNFTNMSSCLSVPEALLTSLTVSTTARFDSVINDDIQLSIYNWTSNSWMTLPNKVLEGTTWKSVTNTINLHNITSAGLYNASSGISIRYMDTSLPDTTRSDLDIDYASVSCDQLSGITWQSVKGSSEMHVNPSQSILGYNYLFGVFTMCGDTSNTDLQSDSSSCSEFYPSPYISDTSQYGGDYEESQGYIKENITLVNTAQTNINSKLFYETPIGVGCDAILDILRYKNATPTDLYSDVVLSTGSQGDNCRLSIPVSFNSSEGSYNVVVITQNYMVWELNRYNRLINFYRQDLENFCNGLAQINNVNLTTPIISNLSEYATNTPLVGCWQMMDDLYWWDKAINNDAITVGGYSPSLINTRFYYQKILDGFNTVKDLKTNTLELFQSETICEKLSGVDLPGEDDFSCQILKQPDNYFSSQEGWILGNMTFTNTYQTSINTYFIWESAEDIDCTAILDVIRVDEQGVEVDIFNDTVFRPGSQSNCRLKLPIQFLSNETSFDILIKSENYIHWNMFQMRDKVEAVRDNTENFCENYLDNVSNTSYYLPINESIDNVSDFLARYCWRALDDLYWWDYYSALHDEVHNDVNNTHYLYELIPSYEEFKYFYPFIEQNELAIKVIEDFKLSEDLQNSVGTRVWTHNESRNLTYYPAQTDLTNYSLIADTVWNWNGIISNNILTQLASIVWNYVTRNLTYYPAQTDMTNYTAIWTYPDRNLTYYTPVNINTTAIAEENWNYTARYTHGVILN